MKIITVLFLSLIVSNANAFFKDNSSFVLKMREFEKVAKLDPTANYQDAIEYRSYVIGVFVSLSLKKGICVSNAKTGKIAEVVVKYINRNPARTQRDEVYSLVKKALETAFPCEN